MRPRRNGGFPEPFDPYQVDFNYTEANAWQYSMFVPQDMITLRRYLGGKDSLQQWLNNLFFNRTQTTGREQADITGLIGQYAQGNEPSHHVAYLYELITAKDTIYSIPDVLTEIIDQFYTDKPDGLCGNEDCGQMSAWLIWAMRKKYPLNIHCNIQALSGRYSVLNEAAIGQYSNIATDLIVPVPIIMGPQTSFTKKSEIRIYNAEPDTRTKVTLKEEGMEDKVFIYTEPFSVYNSCEIIAYSEKEGYLKSKSSRATFIKRNDKRKMISSSEYDQQYAAGGDESMIDGMRGGDDFRTQHWQGFNGKDVEFVIDLGESNEITYLGLSCYQEIKPWIWMPSQVLFYGSRDGINFRPLGATKSDVAIDDERITRKEISLTIPAEKMRYVKIVAKPAFDVIPSWHLGAGGKPWIFVDEVIVR
jgi:Glycosyl hydrolase family 92/F5/8 type C domain